MVEVREIDFQFKECRFFPFDTRPRQRWEDIELMQYTGLKDIKGKEIYEGDIMHHTDGYCEVVFFDDSFVATFKTGEVVTLEECNYVVGNIYENTEILK